ncbi:histidine phosphatase family protein [Streptomyces sp. NBC_01808]|uniref:histidine phosphatase family protein n=1 Tax=Streptomyces sp. NBC_01808 TaxID=2975947 RepID=UPI002DDB1405|nr:histidine phosphatase family protein [Streptomyces sp. NBC_01808]WSA39708.1 histidine phosphatase family protein [Streptomyces sp. NBC_01808]
MGDLLLVRHGQTEWSRDGRHTGRTDLPLTDVGEDQAGALAPLLAGRRIATVLCSPLQRAVRTAELALPGRRGAVLEPRLQEWDYGGYEGLTTPEIQAERPGWDLWHDGVPAGGPGHPGETLASVGRRCDEVLAVADAARQETDGDVLLVAHGHVLRVLTARRLGQHPAAGALYRLETATLSVLGTEHDRPVLLGWNIPAGSAR